VNSQIGLCTGGNNIFRYKGKDHTIEFITHQSSSGAPRVHAKILWLYFCPEERCQNGLTEGGFIEGGCPEGGVAGGGAPEVGAGAGGGGTPRSGGEGVGGGRDEGAMVGSETTGRGDGGGGGWDRAGVVSRATANRRKNTCIRVET
jgi:hypothetical protein